MWLMTACFTEMISHWLKHSTSDHKSLKSKLVDALKSPVIDRLDIVKEIEAMQQTKLRWGLNTFGELNLIISLIK